MRQKKSLLRQAAGRIPEAERRLYRKADDVAARIIELMQEHGLSQRALAEKVGKKEGYVSRVLGGGVNLTLKTIAEFEAALEADILVLPAPRPEPPRRRRVPAGAGTINPAT